MRHPCRKAGGKRPVSRPALRKWLKTEFGYDDRKGVGACDREPSGLEDDEIREEVVNCLLPHLHVIRVSH